MVNEFGGYPSESKHLTRRGSKMKVFRSGNVAKFSHIALIRFGILAQHLDPGKKGAFQSQQVVHINMNL